MSVRDRLMAAHVTKRRRMTPDDAGVFRLASNIGYGFADSIADLIDNSIDAGARNILVRMYQEDDRLKRLAVVDDGGGMDAEALVEAMRLGTSRTHPGSLGKYGIGLKAASFSHTDTLTVVSRKNGVPSAVRYTPEGIREGWKLDQLDDATADGALREPWGSHVDTDTSGTLVLWENMPKFAAAGGDPTRRFGQQARHLSAHLGLHFQRFLERDLSILIDLFVEERGDAGLARLIPPINPFPNTSGVVGYPTTFQLIISGGSSLELRAFIWPANSKDPGYRLDGKAAQRQGFYFYRNDRLIQAGGWNGWRNNDAEPHFSLARAELNLPGDDARFGLNAQKNGIVPPPGFVDALNASRAGTSSLADYIRRAEEAYRQASDGPSEKPTTILRGGVKAAIRAELSSIRSNGASGFMEITLRWSRLPPERFFEMNTEEGEIRLNDRYRSKVLNGDRPTATDAPLVKTLLFLLIGDDLLRQKMTRAVRRRHDVVDASLLAVLDNE